MLNNLLLFSLLFITLTAPTAFSQEKGADVLTVNPAFAEIDKGTRVKRETTTIAEGDHSLISRFPGAKNFKSSRLDFDAVEFPSSDTESFASPKKIPLRGDVYRASYLVENASSLEIIESYRLALEKAGFMVEKECAPDTCRDAHGRQESEKLFGENDSFWGNNPRFLVAVKDGVYVGVFSNQGDVESNVKMKIVDTNRSLGRLLTADVNALRSTSDKAPVSVPTAHQEGDHPLLSRYPGAVNFHHTQTDYEEVQFISGETRDFGGPVTTPLKGDVYRAVYSVKGASSLKVLENYKAALTDAGFDLMGECTPTSCANVGASFTTESLLMSERRPFAAFKPYILTARKGGVHVAVFTNMQDEQSYVKLMIVETEELGEKLLTTDASEIARKIEQDGKVAIYGIYFDTGKAEIKPESQETLDAMAEYLQKHPASNFYVVGHTDDTGELEANVQLSAARAQALVTRMAEQYKIEPNRLLAKGVGPYSPEGSNLTGKGKAENRRVELVLRLPKS